MPIVRPEHGAFRTGYYLDFNSIRKSFHRRNGMTKLFLPPDIQDVHV